MATSRGQCSLAGSMEKLWDASATRDESRMGKSRIDRYRITDFVSFVPIDFEPDVENENGIYKTVNGNSRVGFPTVSPGSRF
jgi:hypothetical protein